MSKEKLNERVSKDYKELVDSGKIVLSEETWNIFWRGYLKGRTQVLESAGDFIETMESNRARKDYFAES